MLSIDCSNIWSDDVDTMVKGVKEATCNIALYECSRVSQQFCEGNFADLKNDIRCILNIWTGQTYIGEKKKEPIKLAFQAFFEALMQLLLSIRSNPRRYSRSEVEFSRAALYQGIVYRYLGHGYYEPSNAVIPYYDNIYVSWSKKPQNSYIESKLYGTMTHMTCVIDNDEYGMDLCAFDVSRGQEDEVVFPTIKEYVTEVKYMEENKQ